MTHEDEAPASVERRTNWAEDRTLLANERTYAAWARTGLAVLAIALGLSALFRQTEPIYAAKAIATLFVAIAVGIFVAGFAEAARVLRRMHPHAVQPISALRLRVLTVTFVIASGLVGVILWML